jgi:serine/threonine protein kinase
MVDADGSARITDFGLAEHQGAAEETDSTTGGTARWTAPEILNGQGTLSKRADVFSFAMVMVEVGCG